MFFILSKLLQCLMMPPFWILAFLTLALIFPRRRKLFLILGMVATYIFNTEFLLKPLQQNWEVPMVWLKDVSPGYEAAIVLGGMAAPGKLPDDRVHFPGSPDRLLHALHLYRAGKAKKIILSGGSGELTGKRIPEASYLAKVMQLCEVKEENIYYEIKSRNTYENALYTKELLHLHKIEKSAFLLVTSAYHMRRAMGCFQKQGIQVIPFSVEGQDIANEFSVFSFIPSPTASGRWYAFVHELAGYVAYKWNGYI